MKITYTVGNTYLGKNLPLWVMANYVRQWMERDGGMNAHSFDSYIEELKSVRFKITENHWIERVS